MSPPLGERRWPAREPARFLASADLKGTSLPTDSRQPHILLIDDTQEILDLLHELLEEEGYRVTTSMARLDLDRIKALAPDIIIQDLLFEGNQETGWRFLTLSQLDPDVARIPLILCTAAVRTVNDPVMAEHLDHLGIRVVLKPFHVDELLTTIREVFAAQALIAQVSGVPGSDGHVPCQTLPEPDVVGPVADGTTEH